MTAPGPAESIGTRRVPARRRIWIVVATIVGVVIAANLVAQGIDRAVGGDQPGGPAGSSYATAPAGLAAFGSLLARYGHDVQQQRGSLTDGVPSPDATVFVLQPTGLTADDAAALLQFVTAGGRLVLGGQSPFYLHDFSDQPPEWRSSGDLQWTVSTTSLGNAHDIEATGTGSWAAPGRSSPLVGTAARSLVTRDTVGRGEIYYLADVSPLDNDLLGAGDNAAFALALAGDATRPVVFAEGVHGYGTSRGLGAIPRRWKVALILIAVAALAFVWSRARRFGPPDRAARDLPPARAAYVDALSVGLERSRDRTGTFAPVQRWARSRFASRTGAAPNADDDQIADAARAGGCSEQEIAALLGPITDDAGVLALGRAVARAGGTDRRMQ